MHIYLRFSLPARRVFVAALLLTTCACTPNGELERSEAATGGAQVENKAPASQSPVTACLGAQLH